MTQSSQTCSMRHTGAGAKHHQKLDGNWDTALRCNSKTSSHVGKAVARAESFDDDLAPSAVPRGSRVAFSFTSRCCFVLLFSSLVNQQAINQSVFSDSNKILICYFVGKLSRFFSYKKSLSVKLRWAIGDQIFCLESSYNLTRTYINQSQEEVGKAH